MRGIERMLTEDSYCIDIITQIAAVQTALEAVPFKILEQHVNHCVAAALASGDGQLAAEKSREMLDPVHRFGRARCARRPGGRRQRPDGVSSVRTVAGSRRVP
jgi:DNA-binding FrmR family transcriptional regulator